MVTAEKYDKGITTIQITTKTLKRLRIIKAEHDYSTFEDVINDGLNFLEDKKLKYCYKKEKEK